MDNKKSPLKRPPSDDTLKDIRLPKREAPDVSILNKVKKNEDSLPINEKHLSFLKPPYHPNEDIKKGPVLKVIDTPFQAPNSFVSYDITQPKEKQVSPPNPELAKLRENLQILFQTGQYPLPLGGGGGGGGEVPVDTMRKSVYDINNDNIVDKAAALFSDPQTISFNDSITTSTNLWSAFKITSVIGSSGGGDMLKVLYDQDDNGIVDYATALTNGTTTYTIEAINAAFGLLDDTETTTGNVWSAFYTWAQIESKANIWDESQIVYVSVDGNDTNDGAAIYKAVKTFSRAIQIANTFIPSELNRIAIRCVDAGTFVENIVLSPYITIFANLATLIGSITLATESRVTFNTIVSYAADAITLAEDGLASINVETVTTTAGFNGVVNSTTFGLLDANIKNLILVDGIGYWNSSPYSGIININSLLISVEGTGTAIRMDAPLGFFMGQINAITDAFLTLGTALGNGTGIILNDGRLNVTVRFLECLNAYVINGGTCHCVFNELIGDKTMNDTSPNHVLIELADVESHMEHSPSIHTVLNDTTTTTNNLWSASKILAEIGDAGGGDMLKAIYDVNDNGLVDYAENLSNGTTTLSVATLNSLKQKLDEDWNDAGVYDLPTLTDHGDGTITIGEGQALLYNTLEYSGLAKYTLNSLTSGGGTLEALTDNTINYICADYDGGTPRWKVYLNRETIISQWGMTTPVYTVYRNGNVIRNMPWDESGKGPASKTILRLINTRRFEREYGLELGQISPQIFTITAGYAWNGVHRQYFSSYNSSTTAAIFFYHSSGNWTSSNVNTFNNSQYDNGTNLVALSNNNKYNINWIYIGMCTAQVVCYILSSTEYDSVEAARLAPVPSSLPSNLSSLGYLIGRIIVKKTALTGTVESVFVQNWGRSAVISHLDLTDIGTNTHVQIDEHIADSSIHTELDDTTTTTNNLWSANKINTLVEGLGFGDMLKSIYDINDNGIVDAAENIANGTTTYSLTTIDTHITNESIHIPVEDTTTTTSNLWSAKGIDARLDRLRNVMSSSLLCGGNLTINADPTKLNIAAGKGIIVNNYTDSCYPTAICVSWDNMVVDPTYLATAIWSGVAITSTGQVLFVEARDFTAEERRDNIVIGFIDHVSLTEINNAQTEPYYFPDMAAKLDDFLTGFGAFNVTGNVYEPSSGLELKRTAGVVFSQGGNYDTSVKSPHLITSTTTEPIEFYYYYRDSGGNWINTETSTTLINPNYYDTTTGLISVPAGKWTVQLLMYYAISDSNDFQYGQQVFDTYADAAASLSVSPTINPYNEYDVFRGWLIVKQGATDLTDTNSCVIVPAGKFGLISSGAGAGGGSGGDMFKSTYDLNDNGIVDHAEELANGTTTYTISDVSTHFNNTTIHTELNDTTTTTSNLWSANKINSLIGISGDMLKSVYDTDNDGLVDYAENVSNGTTTVSVSTINSHITNNTIHTTLSDTTTTTSNLWSASHTNTQIITRGDMFKSTYDTNSNNIVDAAENVSNGTTTVSVSTINVHINQSTSVHIQMDDALTTTNNLWSANKTNSMLPIFGTQFQYTQTATNSTTNSATYVTRETLTLTGVPAGTYRVEYYLEGQYPTTTATWYNRLYLNGTTTLIEQEEEPGDTTDWGARSGSWYVTLTAGNHTITLQARVESTGTTLTMRRSNLAIWRVS